jgi:hypothetical protein
MAAHGNSSPILRHSRTKQPIAKLTKASEVPSGQTTLLLEKSDQIYRRSFRGNPDATVEGKEHGGTSRLGIPIPQWK